MSLCSWKTDCLSYMKGGMRNNSGNPELLSFVSMKKELSAGQNLSCSHSAHPCVFEAICLIWADGGELLWDALMGMRSPVGR